jgi:hypothetical protein
MAIPTVSVPQFNGVFAPTSIPNAALVNSSVTVTAGTGLAGGGAVALGASVSVSLPNTGPGAGTIGGAGNHIVSITLDAQGRVTAATSAADATLFYQTVQNGGVDLTQRAKLNAGAGLVATDDGANSRTTVSIDYTQSPTWTGNHIYTGTIAQNIASVVGQQTAHSLIATTAATSSGTQSSSPGLQFSSQHWETTASAGQQLDWLFQAVPNAAASPIAGQFSIYRQKNGGGWTEVMRISDSGSILSGNAISAGLTGTGNVFGSAFGPNTASTAITFGASSNTSAVGIGRSGITTTITGALTQLTGTFSLTGNGASSITTTSGNATYDSAAQANLGTSTATQVTLGRTGINVIVPGGVIRASTPGTNLAGVNFSIGLNNGGVAGGGSAAGAAGANTYTSGQGGQANAVAGETATSGGITTVSGGQGGTGAASVNGPAGGGNLFVQGGAAGSLTSGFGGANGGHLFLRAGALSGTGSAGTVFIGDSNTGAVVIGNDAITYGTSTSASKLILGAQQSTANTVGGNLIIAASGGGNSNGSGAGGKGGSATFRGATGGSGSGAQNPGAGGDSFFIAGGGNIGGTGNSSGGDSYLRGGNKQGTGTDGRVFIGDLNTSSIAVGVSGITTTVTGALTQLTGAYSLTGNAASTLTTTTGGLEVSAAGTVNVGTTKGQVVIGRSAGITQIVGGSTSSFDLSAGSGVFSTTTGAISLNGNATLADTKSLTVSYNGNLTDYATAGAAWVSQRNTTAASNLQTQSAPGQEWIGRGWSYTPGTVGSATRTQAQANVGNVVRTGGSLVTVTTTAAHGFSTGQMVYLSPGETNLFSAAKGPITVLSSTQFTYTDAGTNVTSTNTQFFTSTVVTTSTAHGFTAGGNVYLYLGDTNFPSAVYGPIGVIDTTHFSFATNAPAAGPSTNFNWFDNTGHDEAVKVMQVMQPSIGQGFSAIGADQGMSAPAMVYYRSGYPNNGAYNEWFRISANDPFAPGNAGFNTDGGVTIRTLTSNNSTPGSFLSLQPSRVALVDDHSLGFYTVSSPSYPSTAGFLSYWGGLVFSSGSYGRSSAMGAAVGLKNAPWYDSFAVRGSFQNLASGDVAAPLWADVGTAWASGPTWFSDLGQPAQPYGSFQLGGGARVQQVGLVTGLTAAATGGSGTTYTYLVTAVDRNGFNTTPTVITVSGANSLSSTVYNTLTWNAVAGAAYYDVYQTSVSQTNWLGQVAAQAPSATFVPATTLSFKHTGVAKERNNPLATPSMTTTSWQVQGGASQTAGLVFSKLNNASTATVTFPAQHGLKVGDAIVITSVSNTGNFANGTYTVTSVASPTVISYLDGLTNVSGSTQTSTGTFAVTRTYSVYAVDADGRVLASTTASANGAAGAHLNNYWIVTWTPIGGAARYIVCRDNTSSPFVVQGQIGVQIPTGTGVTLSKTSPSNTVTVTNAAGHGFMKDDFFSLTNSSNLTHFANNVAYQVTTVLNATQFQYTDSTGGAFTGTATADYSAAVGVTTSSVIDYGQPTRTIGAGTRNNTADTIFDGRVIVKTPTPPTATQLAAAQTILPASQVWQDSAGISHYGIDGFGFPSLGSRFEMRENWMMNQTLSASQTGAVITGGLWKYTTSVNATGFTNTSGLATGFPSASGVTIGTGTANTNSTIVQSISASSTRRSWATSTPSPNSRSRCRRRAVATTSRSRWA